MLNELQKLDCRHGDHLFFLCNLRPIRRILGIGYTSSSDEEIPILCQVKEDSRYDIVDGYKVELEPIEAFRKYFPTRNYYQCDLISLIKSGQVTVLIKEAQEETI